jgi:hypothetical protein
VRASEVGLSGIKRQRQAGAFIDQERCVSLWQERQMSKWALAIIGMLVIGAAEAQAQVDCTAPGVPAGCVAAVYCTAPGVPVGCIPGVGSPGGGVGTDVGIGGGAPGVGVGTDVGIGGGAPGVGVGTDVGVGGGRPGRRR